MKVDVDGKIIAQHYHDKLMHLPGVLRGLASQENCDGEPYDEMCAAAAYIDRLEKMLVLMYRAGYEEGLKPFAYMNDGVSYVGMQRTRLTDAIAKIEATYNYDPDFAEKHVREEAFKSE